MSPFDHPGFVVALTIATVALALALGGAEAESIEDLYIEHNIVNKLNNVTVVTINGNDQVTLYSVSYRVTSRDLQQEITSGSEIFTLDPASQRETNFTFTIPLSGIHELNVTMISNYNGTLANAYWQADILFVDETDMDLTNYITIDYDLEPNNGLWYYNPGEERLRTTAINGSDSEFGLIMGPFEIARLTDVTLYLTHAYRFSEGEELAIEYALDFNPANKYATDWEVLQNLTVGEDSGELVINLPPAEELYLQFHVTSPSDEVTAYWNIEALRYTSVYPKHRLTISHAEHYFVDLEKNNAVTVNLTNLGQFDELWGNVSIEIALYGSEGLVAQGHYSGSIDAEQTFSFDYQLPTVTPGIYYGTLDVTILTPEIYHYTSEFYISYSKARYEIQPNDEITLSPENPLTLPNYEFREALLLVAGAPLDLSFSVPVSESQTLGAHRLYTLGSGDGSLTLTSDSTTTLRLVSLINLDVHAFTAVLNTPELEFTARKAYPVDLHINNEGFYQETYDLTTIFNGSFLELTGPNAITIPADSQSEVHFSVLPLAGLPEQSLDYLLFEISPRGDNATQTLIALANYRLPAPAVEEISFNRMSILADQTITSTIRIANHGYSIADLSLEIVVTDALNQIAYRKVHAPISLAFEEQFAVSEEITLTNGSVYHLDVTISDARGQVVAQKSSQNFHVIDNRPQTTTDETQISVAPEVATALLTLSLLGTIFYGTQSENFKYHAFKLLIPLYSRLQPDSLADDTTRQNLMDFIYGNPGANFTQLKREFALHNGTLAHHITVLENNQIIESRKFGRQRLFFPMDRISYGKVRKQMLTNEIQKGIIAFVKQYPGSTQTVIATHLNSSRQKINYHINSLSKHGLIRIEKSGRISRIFPLHFT